MPSRGSASGTRSVAMLVTGKARRYLRTSTALFCLSLCMICTYLVLVESEYLQRKGDFTDNAAVHLVRVSGGIAEGGRGHLLFRDLDRVDEVVQRDHPSVAVETTTVYALGYGIPDETGEPRFVYGLEGPGERLLGVPDMRDGVAYSTGAAGGPTVTLDVPVVRVEDGGFSSGETVQRQLAVQSAVPRDNPLDVLGAGDPAALYVTGATFEGLVEDSFGVPWAEFAERFDRDNPFGIQVIKDVYVDVRSLDDVKGVAESVEAAGYSTGYTLKAFDDLAGSLGRSALLGMLAVAAAFLACLVYVLLSVNSYLQVSHKDMAILRHAGFTARQVGRMYGARLLQVFAVIAGVTAVYQTALAAWVLREDALRMTGLNLLLVAVLLVGLCAVVLRSMVDRHTRLDVLTLLKADREFE